jgi:Small-conductance mechanosensitive channel
MWVLQSLPPVAREFIAAVPQAIWVAILIFIASVTTAIITGRITTRLLLQLNIPAVTEGTAFERTAQEFGTSTVNLISGLVRYFIIAGGVVGSLSVTDLQYGTTLWQEAVQFLPRVFIALLVIVTGILVGDKVELFVDEQLRQVKLPEITIISRLAKITTFYIAALVGLSQLGVATLALVVLLAVYLFAVVAFAVVAFVDLLKSAAVGTYLLLHQPYAIGDEVEIGDTRGIVQEIDLFVTHVENDTEELIIPNTLVFKRGIIRIR